MADGSTAVWRCNDKSCGNHMSPLPAGQPLPEPAVLTVDMEPDPAELAELLLKQGELIDWAISCLKLGLTHEARKALEQAQL